MGTVVSREEMVCAQATALQTYKPYRMRFFFQFLRDISDFVNTVKNTRLKNTRRFDVFGRHCEVKKRQCGYSINSRKNNSSLTEKKVT